MTFFKNSISFKKGSHWLLVLYKVLLHWKYNGCNFEGNLQPYDFSKGLYAQYVVAMNRYWLAAPKFFLGQTELVLRIRNLLNSPVIYSL